jgi:dynein heavy chain, axonemal
VCLQFEESGQITGMVSVENEKVVFVEPINPQATGAVEKWLLETERVMKCTLHKVAGDALRSYAQSERSKWILEWPGQLVLNCSQVYWTQVCATSSTPFVVHSVSSPGQS